MALGAQIFKANINLANLNANYYEDLSLTIALHPSETKERMMFRLIALLVSHQEYLEFTNGLDNPDLPDIWQKDLCGDIEHWIELGQPDEKKIKKACGRSKKVSIFTYDEFKAEPWLEKNQEKLKSNKKINIYNLRKVEESNLLIDLVKRSMNLTCMIEENNIFLSNDDLRVQVTIQHIF